MKKLKNKRLIFALDEKMLQQIKIVSDKSDKKISEFIRYSIKKELERWGY